MRYLRPLYTVPPTKGVGKKSLSPLQIQLTERKCPFTLICHVSNKRLNSRLEREIKQSLFTLPAPPRQVPNTKARKEAIKTKRMFGIFECSLCSKGWQSAYTWCDEAGEPVYTQQCKSCKTEEYPYKVFELECSKCGKTVKNCKCRKEMIVCDENKPHLQDLCERCQHLGRPCYRSVNGRQLQ